MQYALNDFYISSLKKKYENADYNEKIFTGPNSRNEYTLDNLIRRQVEFLLEDGFPLTKIINTEEDIKMYRYILWNYRYDVDGINLLKKPYYFLSIEDLNQLKENLLTVPEAVNNLLQDKALCLQLELDNNISHYLSLGFICNNDRTYSYDALSIIENWFEYFSERELEYIRLACITNSSLLNKILCSEKIPLTFQQKLYDDCIQHCDNYTLKSIFNNISSLRTTIQASLFSYLIHNNDIILQYWLDLTEHLSNPQLNILYNKYYKQLFEDTSSWKTFSYNCKRFGKVLRKREKDLLLKRLKAPSRRYDISSIKEAVNFTEDELMKLDTIMLTHKMAE